MIGTVVRIGMLRLRNNPMELVLMFCVPIIFFSIFGLIFGRGIGSGKANPVKTVFVNEDESEVAKEILMSLASEAGLRNVADSVIDQSLVGVVRFESDSADENASRNSTEVATITDREAARNLIQDGSAVLAIVIPEGFSERLESGETNEVVSLLADTSDQIATQVASALIRQTVLQKVAELQFEQAQQQARQANGGPPNGQPVSIDQPTMELARESEPVEDAGVTDPVQVTDVLASSIANPRISMYAAGIAVMFLLFSASGAGGTLLEELEAGTLERLLTSQLTLTQLLTGKWLYITGIGILQITVMFIFAQLVFGVDLAGHLAGFFVMTSCTSAAAASLALLLATACSSRSQLNGISVILILTMSALGGSMVPRYIMSEQMQEYGLITFNAWALDGYNKVFWRNLPIEQLKPQVIVLIASTVVMALAARIFANRWKA